MKNDNFPIELLRPSIIKVIKQNNPDLLKEKFINLTDLDEIKRIYFLETLKKGDVEAVADIEQIAKSLTSKTFVTSNVNTLYADKSKATDSFIHGVASFFGSWPFIILIFLLIGFWLLFNSFAKQGSQFDPYPFAILGLFLTGLSALQAPFILNSQKLQSKRDKIKFDEDYQTNLKSELEIRNLHSKMDFYNKKIWEKLNDLENKF